MYSDEDMVQAYKEGYNAGLKDNVCGRSYGMLAEVRELRRFSPTIYGPGINQIVGMKRDKKKGDYVLLQDVINVIEEHFI
jgi:hypothetical protein